jgi:hypothetical protein
MDSAHLALNMPEGIDTATWAGIQAQVDRLMRAVHDQDRSLVVGTTKELVEATAWAVLHARGQQVASGDEFDKVLSNAHEILEYQTGPGLAPDAPVRAIASGAKKIAGRLRELRNDLGTGHGRHLVPVIEDEALDLCIEASLLWTRWALRRLEHLIAGSPTALVRDLWSATFTSGKLAARLQAANLPALGPNDQRVLGVAVGQRASRGTFMVRIEGVEACAQDQNDAAWPSAYREGVIEGLFINYQGQVQIDTPGPRLAAQVLAPHPDATGVLLRLEEKLRNSGWSSGFTQRWRAVVEAIRASAGVLQGEAPTVWMRIADELRYRGESIEAASG